MIKKTAPEIIMKDRIVKSSGYKIIKLTKDKKESHLYVHKLVAQAFIPNPENKPQVNHINGNKINNCVNNLEWVTAKENIEKAIETGLIKADGCNNYRSKFSPEDIREIRANYKPQDEVWGVKALTKKYNCNRSTIFSILSRKTYKNF